MEKKSSSIMMVLSIFSPDERYSSTYIDNYANLYVLEELKRVPGANRAQVFGLPDIAMRVWLRPDRMAQLGISVQEVANAIQSQNQTFGIGQIGAQPSPAGRAADVRRHRAGAADQAGGVREHHRPHGEGGHGDRARARHRPGRARQARLLDREPHERQDRNHHRHLPAAGRERGGDRARGARAARGAEEAVPDRPRLQDHARHQPVHAELDRQGGAHVLRGGRAGGPGGVSRSCSPCARRSSRSSPCRCRSSARSSACTSSASRSTC